MDGNLKEILSNHKKMKDLQVTVAKQTVMGNIESLRESKYELQTVANKQDLLLDHLVEEYSGELE
jgi:hypothetical protein